MDLPKVSVIIVSYNGEKWINECIRSILRNNYGYSEIVVVDNASQDRTASIIQGNFREVILLNQRKNIGFGRGANVGIQYAMSQKADYILLLNQDIKLDEHCIESMITVCEGKREIGIASPLQMNYAGSAVDAHFARLYGFKQGTGLAKKDVSMDSFEVDTVIGASMLIRSSVIEKIGGFDPLFFLYHEEGDLCRRARYHGVKIHIIPKAVVYHKHIQLAPEEMTFKAKLSSTYGYYIYILKNPFTPFRQNLNTMMRQMNKWMCRDRNIIKMARRLLINVAAGTVVLVKMPLIIRNRKDDRVSGKNLYLQQGGQRRQ